MFSGQETDPGQGKEGRQDQRKAQQADGCPAQGHGRETGQARAEEGEHTEAKGKGTEGQGGR